MANDKKNINKLVPDTDNDTTAELEALCVPPGASDHFDDVELEADAHTHDFIDASDEGGEDTVSSLRKALKIRDDSINRLQFDLERLRARSAGMEKEIRAREILTEKVNSDLRQAREDLQAVQRRLTDRDAAVDALNTRILQSSEGMSELRRTITGLENATHERDALVARLEEQVAQYAEKISTLQDELQGRSAGLAETQQLQASQRQEIEDAIAARDAARRELAALHEKSESEQAQLRERLDRLQDELKSGRSKDREAAELIQRLVTRENEICALNEQLATAKAALDDQRLARRTSVDVDEEHAADRELLERQKGLLLSNRQEIRELQQQIARTEGYADSLRRQLAAQVGLAGDAAQQQVRLEAELASARRQLAELAAQLDGEQSANAELRDQVARLQDGFEEEVRRIRFELGAAQQTIADHESISEQLSSDLIDNQSFRQALELQLAATEEKSVERIRELKRRIRSLERHREEDRHKLSNKDSAIAALLNELASRNPVAEPDESDAPVLQERAGELDREACERGVPERVTRLLVGSVGGQELRFPLFKDKLTIGRTARNDIQLKAPYVSRRHALIVTEDDRTKILDWGSKNGVFVNERRVSDCTLRNGDVVTIGNADFRYEERAKR